MAVTLTNLILRVRQEADMVNTQFVTDAELTTYINQSYAELYGIVVQAYGNDYNVATPYSFVTDGINNLFALPTDFFKLLGVDLQVQASQLWLTLKPFTFQDRNRFGLVNSPVPMAGQTIRLWYVPALSPLSTGTDAVITPLVANGWDEYIVIDAAMKAMAKEESDVSVLMARKQAMIARLNSETENRDAGNPTAIVDFYKSTSPAMRYHITGSQLWLQGGNTPAYPYGDGFMGGWW